MINDQLLGYIRQQLASGVSKEVIISNLKSQGWTDVDVNEAFTMVPAQSVSPVNSVLQNTILQGEHPQEMAGQTTSGLNNPTNEPQPTHKKNKKVLLIVAIIILLCAISGVVYAYYSGLFLSLPNLTSKALDNVRNTNSATYDTTISFDFSELKDTTGEVNQLLSGGMFPSSFSFTTKGSYDFSDTNNKKLSSNISINGGLFSIMLDFKLVDDTLFGELVKAPTLSFLPTLTKYENKWFSFSFKSAEAQSLNNMFNPVSGISGVDSKVTDKITPEQLAKIYQMTRNANFIKTVQRFSPETISGQSSYHFAFDLDKGGIISYFKNLKEYVNSIGKNDSSLSSFDPTSFTADLDKIKDFKGEIWIGRKDNLPYKVTLSFGVKPDESKNETIKINIVSIFSDWNKPTLITAPTESVPFQEFISSVTSDLSGSTATEQTQTKQKKPTTGIVLPK